jgi:hypothetical protein
LGGKEKGKAEERLAIVVDFMDDYYRHIGRRRYRLRQPRSAHPWANRKELGCSSSEQRIGCAL